jgi:hypothetical protein
MKVQTIVMLFFTAVTAASAIPAFNGKIHHTKLFHLLMTMTNTNILERGVTGFQVKLDPTIIDPKKLLDDLKKKADELKKKLEDDLKKKAEDAKRSLRMPRRPLRRRPRKRLKLTSKPLRKRLRRRRRPIKRPPRRLPRRRRRLIKFLLTRQKRIKLRPTRRRARQFR